MKHKPCAMHSFRDFGCGSHRPSTIFFRQVHPKLTISFEDLTLELKKNGKSILNGITGSPQAAGLGLLHAQISHPPCLNDWHGGRHLLPSYGGRDPWWQRLRENDVPQCPLWESHLW